MNLKESFRYQNFIKVIFDEARMSITNSAHAYSVTKLHKRHEANPAVEDLTEEPEIPEFHKNDDVVAMMTVLMAEKEKLSRAIAEAKYRVLSETGLQIDQATECNKMRREMITAINRMMAFKANKRMGRGQAYLINGEGNQTAYYYDIEMTNNEAYDRMSAKSLVGNLSTEADEISSAIDRAMVNAEVAFEPMFDINDTFDDAMEKVIHSLAEEPAEI